MPSKLHGGPSDPDQKTEILEMIRLLKSKSILLESITVIYQTYTRQSKTGQATLA